MLAYDGLCPIMNLSDFIQACSDGLYDNHIAKAHLIPGHPGILEPRVKSSVTCD